ncbi:MAG: cation:proton antiporter [Deltaproteobacteria bacterium]|nr:cation:proton antiporter [Deltaproteobacteria bacterium]MCL4874125.1 cation:proton antiporter [bacterium]
MENIPLLRDIVILLAVSVPLSMLLSRLGLPTVVGFLITGIVIGPYGFGLVRDVHTVELLAQVGVVLLLFTIGLEFSISKLLNIRREGLIGGGLQVGLTVLCVAVLSLVLGYDLKVAVLLGFVVSLSSTAIVLKLLADRGDVNTPHGNFSVGVLIFQDLAVVLMVMVLQSIGLNGGASPLDISKKLGVSFAAFAIIVAGVVWLIPRLFDQVVKLRNREVFILTIVLVCLGTAWFTSLFGLSLALGAFIAGLAISESEYSNQIVAEVIPFRDTFSSLFFISIGMLLDLSFFIGHIGWVALLVAAIIATKALVVIGIGRVLKYPFRLSVIVGLNLAQIGEFSFILIKMGQDYNLLNEVLYQSFLASAIITMALTPFIYQRSARLAFDLGKLLGMGGGHPGQKKTHLSNHVIIVGYGLNGRNLARVLKETGIPHAIMEMNMERVKAAKAEGHSAYFGDASHPEVFKKLGVEKAKMVVTAISDPISTRAIVKTAREISPTVSIIVRTRFVKEVEDLYRLGANQVIPEEFETSVEIFARVLKDYRIPTNIIQNQIDLIREEGYAMLRNPALSTDRLSRLSAILEKTVMDTFYVDDACSVAGSTLRDLDFRKRTGATVIAIARGNVANTNPGPDFSIEKGDILVLLGSHAQLAAAFQILNEKCPITKA